MALPRSSSCSDSSATALSPLAATGATAAQPGSPGVTRRGSLVLVNPGAGQEVFRAYSVEELHDMRAAGVALVPSRWVHRLPTAAWQPRLGGV
jgi:hypothetical protein